MMPMEGSWYAAHESLPRPMAHVVWVGASGGALTHCLGSVRIGQLRPQIPTDLVCPDCWGAVNDPRTLQDEAQRVLKGHRNQLKADHDRIGRLLGELDGPG